MSCSCVSNEYARAALPHGKSSRKESKTDVRNRLRAIHPWYPTPITLDVFNDSMELTSYEMLFCRVRNQLSGLFCARRGCRLTRKCLTARVSWDHMDRARETSPLPASVEWGAWTMAWC
jgi:hypothetical protein